MTYPWYEFVKDLKVIEQGDFISNCPIVIPPASYTNDEEIVVDILEVDVIVLSQSCDIVNENIEIIQVCPFIPLAKFFKSLPPEHTSTNKAKQKVIENMRKGFLPGYHLLNKMDGFFIDYQVVDFRNVYGIHFSALKSLFSLKESRIRLLPPYKEHLSQSFARFFMRVGLPTDIKIEKAYLQNL